MPTIRDNLNYWERECDWSRQGEEWSQPWGGSETQWWGSILPRIHAFVPCDSILEIAPGFGRWTQYLKGLAKRVTLVDLSERCIEGCRQRFAADSHISYFANDGKSLDMIADHSIDFVFSFDSLVHAEADVLEAYVRQLAHKLARDGVGFIHHSNAARYARYFSLIKMKRPAGHDAHSDAASESSRNGSPSLLRLGLRRAKGLLTKVGILARDHNRALSMSGERFREFCERSGLRCISQEFLGGDQRMLIDCISVFTREGSRWDRPIRVLENRRFAQEARNLSRLAKLYSVRS